LIDLLFILLALQAYGFFPSYVARLDFHRFTVSYSVYYNFFF